MSELNNPPKPQYLLTVIVPRGINAREFPRPESQGSKIVRAYPVGAQLYAYVIHRFEGVPYALLVPKDPTRNEWVRVSEADDSGKNVEIFELSPADTTAIDSIAAAISHLADVLERKLK